MAWRLAFFACLVAVCAAGNGYTNSDSDDAMRIGAAAIIRGESPYRARTQLGNPLTPMLGAFVLAGPLSWAPWAINLVWLGALYLFLPDDRRDLAMVVVLLLGAKTLIAGIDYLGNACQVCVPILILWRAKG